VISRETFPPFSGPSCSGPFRRPQKKMKFNVDGYGIMPYSVIVIKGMTPETQNQK